MAHAADPRGYYQVLGVAPSATAEEIRLAFRDSAKRFHPDHGSEDDGERFRQLTEAYETLRDGRRRMQYDAERIAGGNRQKQDPAAANSTIRKAKTPKVGLNSLFSMGRWMTLASAGLAIALLTTLGFLWSAQQQLAEQGVMLQDAYLRMDSVVEDQAEMRARYRAANFMRLEEALVASEPGQPITDNGFVFQAELAFPPNIFELVAEVQSQLDKAIVELADTIQAIPADRDWLILLDGYTGKAAEPGGVAVGAWESALLRLGSVTDYLTSQGIPPDRLAVRFQAGFQPVGEQSANAGTVEVKLLCCYR